VKKFFKVFGWILVLATLGAVGYVMVTFPPVMAGMAAKITCSCVYVMNRSVESVRQKELQVFPGLSRASIQLEADSSVKATVLARSRKAIYRNGLGCTLLAEQSEETVRAQRFLLPTPRHVKADTLPWPAGNRLTPVEANYNKMLMDSILDVVFTNDAEQPWNTQAMVVVHNGQLVAERYAEGIDSSSRLMGWSMTKSVTNALVGLLVKEGLISPLEYAALPEWQNDKRKEIRIENLLHATSGLAWNEGYFNPNGYFHSMFTQRDNKGLYAAGTNLQHTPGTVWQYSSGTTNILSRIIRMKTGDSLYHRYPYEKLFYRLGMYSMLLEPDASGTFVGSSYGYASARDWARFGLLYLNDGYWGNERILPEGWVEYTTTPAAPAPQGEYGAQWWLNRGKDGQRKYPLLPDDTFWADGFEEQYVMVIPSRNIVIVRLGVSHHGFPMEKIASEVLRCFSSD
jgi:CubicO group peptidase (beta-lactamase class C family)